MEKDSTEESIPIEKVDPIRGDKEKNADENKEKENAGRENKRIIMHLLRTQRSNSLSSEKPMKMKLLDTSNRDEKLYKRIECPEFFVLKETMEIITHLSAELGKHIEQNTKRWIKDTSEDTKWD